MTRSKTCLILTCFFLSCIYIHAQSSIAQNDSLLSAALQLYHAAEGDQSGILNGSLYVRPKPTDQGHAYFKNDALKKGAVFYDKAWYDNVPLLYDETTDDLITTDISGLNLVILIKQKIISFNIGTDRFIHLVGSNDMQPGKGFYRLVHEGAFNILHRETKKIREKIVREKEMERYVEVRGEYFLIKNGRWQKIENMRSFYRLFPSEKKLLQEHLRSKGLKSGKELELSLVEAVKFLEKRAVL